MTKQTQALYAQAVQLPLAERLELAEQLLSSLDQIDPAVDTAWLHEAEARLQAWRQGRVKSFALSDVLAKYGK